MKNVFRRHRSRIAGCSAVLLLAVSCSSQRDLGEYFYSNFGQHWTKYIPAHDSLEQFRLSADGQQVSYLLKHQGRWLVGINGRHYPNFEGTYQSQDSETVQNIVSPDGRHKAVIFKREPSFRPDSSSSVDAALRPQWFVEIDRHIFGGYDGDFVPKVRFSKTGGFAMAYKQRGQYYLQVMDVTFGPYHRADFTVTPEDVVVVAYLRGSYIHVERLGKLKAQDHGR